MMDGNLPDDIPLKIFIKSTKGSEIASKINGYFILHGNKFNFTAIAFGRIGGHNISLKIAKTTINKIKDLGIDPEALQLLIQRKLIEGDIVLPDGLKPPE